MNSTPVKIGSFNMCKFNYTSTQEISKNITTIAEIIRVEDFDILAMQEVLSENVITSRLLAELGPRWDCVWMQPASRSTQAAEGYAYLWKKERFRLATGQKSPEEDSPAARKVFSPRIYSQYSPDALLVNGRLIRDPFYARFESLNGWYEIRLINTHIFFGSGNALDIRMRFQEFDKLVEIFERVSDRVYRNGRPAYTFILGDYNLNLERPWNKFPCLRQDQETVLRGSSGRGEKRIVTKQDQMTTLRAKASDELARGYANNYDHFTYDEVRFEGIRLPHCMRIDTVRTYCGDDFDLHRREVSDHIPICLTFSLTG